MEVILSNDYVKETKAIQTILDEETTSWNTRDAEGYSKNFAEDGTFTNILGAFTIGKKTFHAKHEQILKGVYSNSIFNQELVSLKFVRPDVAIVETLVSLVGFPKRGPFEILHTDEEGRFHTYLLQVMVLEENDWKIVAYHNVDVKAGVALAKTLQS